MSFTAAIKRVIAWQIEREMKAQKLSKITLTVRNLPAGAVFDASLGVKSDDWGTDLLAHFVFANGTLI